MATGGETLESLYNEAYALVDQGICYDEVGHREGALAMYGRGLELIDRAGQMSGAEQSPMYQKMVNAREHILHRLRDLKPMEATPMATPPPYEAIEDTLNAFGDAKSAEELLFIPGGVQIFLIRGEDTSVPSYPSFLKIFKFRPDSPRFSRAGASSEPPAFLQVEDWVYPLVPGRSPVLHSTYGAYIFPNPSVDFPDLYVGLILPSDLDEATLKAFQSLMKEYTELRQQQTPPELTASESEKLTTKISKLLVSGGQLIAWGIEKGAGMTSEVIGKQGEKMRQRMEPHTVPVPVDPRVQTSVHYLRRGSKVAVRVSGYVVNKIGKAAVVLGQHLAGRTQKSLEGTKAAGVVAGTLEVVKGGITGVATVWMGLETAAKTLAKDISNETVQVAHHKYGQDVARVTDDALRTVRHSGLTAWNLYHLGPKAIAKRTATTAGTSFLKDLGGDKEKSKSDGPSK